MSNVFQYSKVGEIAELLDCLHKTPSYSPIGIPIVRVTDVKQGYLKLDTCLTISENDYQVFSKGYKPQPGDIVFTRVGSYGNSALVRDDNNFCLGQNTVLVIPKKVDGVFLFYWMSSPECKSEIESLAGGSTQPTISMASIRKIEVPIPPLPEQQAIAEVLSSLDDKIDLLHRNNKTLEEMAETLFRQWFVEGAKEEWEVVTLKDLCKKITKGTTPTTMGKKFQEQGINFIKAESIEDHGSFNRNKFSFIDQETHELLSRSQLSPGDVLYTIAGTIGRTSIVPESVIPANTNQAVAILKNDPEKISSTFLKYLMKSDIIKETLESKVVHAVQPNLSLGEISSTSLQMPPKILLDKFDSIAQSLMNKLENNTSELDSLIKTRNTLLPKLMSGQVRVKKKLDS